jgi:hypothetical protein
VATATVGDGKAVTVTGYSISGTHASNYSLTQPTGVTVNITAKALTITGASATNRAYDGSTTVAVSGGSLVGVESGDTVTLGGSPTGTVATAAAADGKAVTVTGYSISGGSASNYSLTQPTGLTVNITKATPTITTAPTASNINSGQALSSSVLSGGAATGVSGSLAGSFAFTTPATTPAVGTASHSVTFTPTDTINYNTATTNVNVTVESGVPAQVTLNRAEGPGNGNFTVVWQNVANETGYHLHYSTNATFASGVTEITDIAADVTSRNLTGLTNGATYYVRVRGVSAGGNGTWSAAQVNQLQSIDNGVTRYMSAPGATASGSYAVNDIFGSNNEAGLATGATGTNATTIQLVAANGSTGTAIFRNSSSQWQQGVSTAAGTVEIGRGRAFILKNNSGSTDYFLLVGTGTNVTPPAVTIDIAAPLALVTTGRTTPTAFTSFVANITPTANPSAPTHFKASAVAAQADQIIVPAEAGQHAQIYFYNPSAKGGASWIVNGRKVSGETIPSGAGVFIRKASGSTLQSFTPPTE